MKWLQLEDRKRIEHLLDQNIGLKEIAKDLGRSAPCISEEIRKNGGVRLYNAEKAQERNILVNKTSRENRPGPLKGLIERMEIIENQLSILIDHLGLKNDI